MNIKQFFINYYLFKIIKNYRTDGHHGSSDHGIDMVNSNVQNKVDIEYGQPQVQATKGFNSFFFNFFYLVISLLFYLFFIFTIMLLFLICPIFLFFYFFFIFTFFYFLAINNFFSPDIIWEEFVHNIIFYFPVSNPKNKDKDEITDQGPGSDNIWRKQLR